MITKAANYRVILASSIPSLRMLDHSAVDSSAALESNVMVSMMKEAAATMTQYEEEVWIWT
jgi:hypothetical protein